MIEADVREQIDYPRLAESYPYDDPESILELICDVQHRRHDPNCQ